MRKIGLLAGLALAACGGGGDGGPSLARTGRDAFVGIWSGSGEVSMTLTTPYGPTPANLPVEGLLVIAVGAGPDTLVLADSTGCTLLATVSGEVATVEPGASCTSSQGSTTTTLFLDLGSATLEGDSLELVSEGSAEVSSGGFQTRGPYRARSTFVRQGE